MYVATSIEISHRENNFSYAAFSGCHSAAVIKGSLITTADGKAYRLGCRAFCNARTAAATFVGSLDVISVSTRPAVEGLRFPFLTALVTKLLRD